MDRWESPPQKEAPKRRSPSYRREPTPSLLMLQSDVAWDLQELLERLSPEDVQRVLDLARRLAR